MNLSENINIYIELDGIFDTRLPLLTSISEEEAIKTFNGNYDKRTNDTFGLVPYSLFDSFYKLRNNNILKYSLPTNIHNIVEYITTMYATDLMNKNIDIQNMYVNLHPYTLDATAKEKMLDTLSGYFKSVNIIFIEYSNMDLTPQVLDTLNIGYIIKYDGLVWLENQFRLHNVIDNPLLDRYMYVPAIVNDVYSLKRVKITKEYLDVMSKSLGMIINLIFTDIIYWNTIKNDDKEKNKDDTDIDPTIQ